MMKKVRRKKLIHIRIQKRARESSSSAALLPSFTRFLFLSPSKAACACSFVFLACFFSRNNIFFLTTNQPTVFFSRLTSPTRPRFAVACRIQMLQACIGINANYQRCRLVWKLLVAASALFSLPQSSKFFHSLSITSIFNCLHGVLNVGKKITNYTV
jgi:hypothetical protein